MTSSFITRARLCGQDEFDLVEVAEFGCKLQREVVPALRQLVKAAAIHGFEVKVASAYRSFAGQQKIWDGKARGGRTVLDGNERPLDISCLSEWEQVQAILRWSALPGASRHHWGTDFDIYEVSSLPAGYKVQLTQAETQAGGVLAVFYEWLDERLEANQAFGFYRPYAQDRGGVAPEPWHLSFRPLSEPCERALTLAALEQVIEESTIELRSTVLAHLEEIYRRFVRC